MFKRVAGTRDILPEQVDFWQRIESISRTVFSIYNYKEIRPPLIEEAGLFNRSLGETTEIVQKQMFLVKKDLDIYALRPEGTAPVVRAYLENNLAKTQPFIKLYYMGPMFRLERPQKGRFRQFHHIGCEVIGSDDSFVDVEVISLADTLLKNFGIEGYRIKINSLGCSKDKKELIETLRKSLKDRLSNLCGDCNERYKLNILRVLDCKNETCQAVISGLKIGNDHLCPQCRTHLASVERGLNSLNINYEVSPHLVRGLDYYTKTVFEIKHKDLDSQQDALGAGGRYDNLVSELGGPKIGAIGFAFGVERLLLVTKSPSHQVSGSDLVYLISLGDEAKLKSLILLDNLRQAGICCDTDYENKSLKGAMRKANDLSAKAVLIIGDDEIKNNVVTFKDMASGEQKQIPIDKIVNELTVNK